MNDLNGNSMPTRPIKKKVSFADTVGFKLETVKIIPSQSKDVVTKDIETKHAIHSGLHMKNLWLKFVEPTCETDSFLERVYRQKVCLERISCDDLVVTGTVRVMNINYVKEVIIRYTLDNWTSFQDIWADYLSSNVDGKTEHFSFRITVPVGFKAEHEIHFAIRYCVAEQEFWDNNCGRNYQIRCLN